VQPVPDSPGAQYALASALAHRASDTNFDRICLYLDQMPTEFRVLSVRDATLRDLILAQTRPPRLPHAALSRGDLAGLPLRCSAFFGDERAVFVLDTAQELTEVGTCAYSDNDQ
jgi:hypothetical protein